MRKPVLVLFALLSLLPLAQSMAQAPAAPAAKPAAAPPVSAATARFLATLSGGQTQTPNDLTPAPTFMTGCNTTGCPTGQICCFLCGNPPDGDTSGCYGCITSFNGRCPRVV